MPDQNSEPQIHTPVLEDAAAHGHGPGDESLSQLAIGDCVAVMAPFDAPNQILVRITAIERTARHPETTFRMPEILVGRIEQDQAWGPVFRTGDPAYAPGALIRFDRDNISHIY